MQSTSKIHSLFTISLVIVFNAVLMSIYKQLTIIVHAILRLICLKKPFKLDINRWIYFSRRGTPGELLGITFSRCDVTTYFIDLFIFRKLLKHDKSVLF